MEANGAKRHKRDHDNGDDKDYDDNAEEDEIFEEDNIIEVTSITDTVDDGFTEEGRRARDEVATGVNIGAALGVSIAVVAAAGAFK